MYSKHSAVYKTALENSEEKLAIQKKSVTFPGTNFINYSTGELYETKTIVVKNNDLGDVSNLLGLF